MVKFEGTKVSFHSINVPSEWGLENNDFQFVPADYRSFHSINVPSEWGRNLVPATVETGKPVSIQLMSPASGDLHQIKDELVKQYHPVSIQLMSPASGDDIATTGKKSTF